MANPIKHLFRVTLFCLSTIILTGYIGAVQATKQEVVEKKILQNRIGAILEEAEKCNMQYNNQSIKFILKGNGEEQIKLKLQKLSDFSLREHKKYFFKLSLEQLQLILPKLEALTSLNKELRMVVKELEEPIEEAFKSVGKVEKEIEQEVLDKAFQKEVEEEIKLEFQEIIKTLQAFRKNPQTTNAILLTNDLKLLCDYDFFLLQIMQEVFLQYSFMQQQFFLPKLKKIRRLTEEQFQIEKELMVAMPDALKKKLQELVKKISHKVHGMLDSYTEAGQVVCIIKRMILLH